VLPADLRIKDVVRGTALTSDQTVYRSVSVMLVEQQLARPG